MECSHCQLSTRLTDGLSSDDTNGFTSLYQSACSHVLAVALSAKTALRSAGHCGSDLDHLDAGILDLLSHVVGDVFTGSEHDLSGLRVNDIFNGISSGDPLPELFDLFLAVSERSYFDTIFSSAVDLVDDDAVRDIYKTSCQIS